MPDLKRGLARALAFRINSYAMLVTLIGLYLLLPLGLELTIRYTWVFHVAFCFVLVSGVLAAETSRRLFAISITLAGTVFLLGWVPYVTDIGENADLFVTFRCVSLGFTILFLGFTTFVFLRSIFTAGRISTEGICAAVCVYFLIGFLFAFTYALVDNVLENPFNQVENKSAVYQAARAIAGETEGITPALTHEAADTVVFLYYSMVTLTTVGYGDITPAHPFAMMLSTMEGFLGQIYIAVLVAWLVGVRVSTSMMERQRISPDE